MNTKHILLLFVLALFLVSCKLPETNTNQTINKTIDLCSELTTCRDLNSTAKLKCCYDYATFNADVPVCEHVGEYRDDCYSVIAVKTLNPGLCQRAGSNEDLCYKLLADKMNNPELCGLMLHENNSQCYSTV